MTRTRLFFDWFCCNCGRDLARGATCWVEQFLDPLVFCRRCATAQRAG